MVDSVVHDPATERRELMAAVLAAAGIRQGSVVLDFTPAAGLGAAAEAMAGAPPTSALDAADVSHALACAGLLDDGEGPSPGAVGEVLPSGARVVLVDRPDELTDDALAAAGLAIRWDGRLAWRGAELRVVAAVRDEPAT